MEIAKIAWTTLETSTLRTPKALKAPKIHMLISIFEETIMVEFSAKLIVNNKYINIRGFFLFFFIFINAIILFL